MKRIFYLLAAVIGLCITSSCGKDFFDQVLLEGNWGLIRYEMVTSVNGVVEEDIVTPLDPFNPKTQMDTQLAIRNISGNQYEFSEYIWDNYSASRKLSIKNVYIVRNDVLFMVQSGREMEYGHFSISASTLTIETIDIHEDLLPSGAIQTSTVSKSTYRRLSEFL